MEEVDKIIIDSLKNIDCNLEDVTNLKQFDAEMATLAISSCLEAISPDSTLPKKLPPSMSARLKLTSNLAEKIKSLGFRGDLGYHSILYCNEVEIRRILMFLIERLPRESSKTVPVEQTGYVPRIVKGIEETLRESLSQAWIPSWLLNRGIREVQGGYLVHSLGDSSRLEITTLEVPDVKGGNEAQNDYWCHIVKDVTKQCPSRNLIPSLLFNDCEFLDSFNLDATQLPNETVVDVINEKAPIEATEIQKEIYQEENSNTVIETLATKLEESKQKYFAVQDATKTTELNLSQMQVKKTEEQEILKETLSKIKLKTKTLAVVENQEKMTELKNLIQNANNRFVKLSNRWNEVQTPVLEEYKSLETTVTSEEAKLQKEQAKLESVRETHGKLSNDLKEKVQLEQVLTQKCQQLNKISNRSAYTRRILEIIGNIRKQNDDIQKILKDTKDVQKYINNLTGQVDRSFTLADEMIFYDAKNEEASRKAYKLLAALRDECNAILKAVEELGLTERESRNLQEQIETEKAKEIGVKLDKVLSDLAEIQKDTQVLLKQ